MSDGFRHQGTLAVIGGGKMGEAIVGGLIAAGALRAEKVVIAEPSGTRRELLEREYSVRTVADGMDALPADVVLVAVKPQVIDEVLAGLADRLGGSLVVSIAAGITTARLESALPEGTRVVRVMPNTPALVGEGMAVVSGGSEVSEDDLALVAGMFSAIGRAIAIDERYQDAASAISGSGPAYVALVVDAMARAGVAQGLPRAVAQDLALQTLRGTVELIDRTGEHPGAVIDAVSSPGGTTIAAINVLESGGVRAAFADAVAAAVKRSKELGS